MLMQATHPRLRAEVLAELETIDEDRPKEQLTTRVLSQRKLRVRQDLARLKARQTRRPRSNDLSDGNCAIARIRTCSGRSK